MYRYVNICKCVCVCISLPWKRRSCGRSMDSLLEKSATRQELAVSALCNRVGTVAFAMDWQTWTHSLHVQCTYNLYSVQQASCTCVYIFCLLPFAHLLSNIIYLKEKVRFSFISYTAVCLFFLIITTFFVRGETKRLVRLRIDITLFLRLYLTRGT